MRRTRDVLSEQRVSLSSRRQLAGLAKVRDPPIDKLSAAPCRGVPSAHRPKGVMRDGLSTCIRGGARRVGEASSGWVDGGLLGGGSDVRSWRQRTLRDGARRALEPLLGFEFVDTPSFGGSSSSVDCQGAARRTAELLAPTTKNLESESMIKCRGIS